MHSGPCCDWKFCIVVWHKEIVPALLALVQTQILRCGPEQGITSYTVILHAEPNPALWPLALNQVFHSIS
jgi:hypothetical protein